MRGSGEGKGEKKRVGEWREEREEESEMDDIQRGDKREGRDENRYG